MLFTKLTTAASLLAFALATPVPEANPEASPVAEAEPLPSPNADVVSSIVKRAEGIHLVNCNKNGNDVYSAIVFCSNDSNCNFFPGAGNQCILGSGGVAHWEGSSQSCTFPGTGVTFSWTINANAQSQANFVQVGNGNNGFRTFSIFKDDKHQMYTDGSANSCRSIYYAI